MILALLLIPAVAGIIAFFLSRAAANRTLLVAGAVLHLALTAYCWHFDAAPLARGWFAVDPLGLLFLSITSVLFLLASIYRIGLKQDEASVKKRDFEEGFFFTSAPEATFCGCMLLFLAAMTLVCVSQQFGIIWVAIEATTLASAPLIYFHRHRRSLEATWKYLLICSVGIALALLGNFFLAIAAWRGGADASLVLDTLTGMGRAGALDTMWLKASFLVLLVGYGTKAGLAPMHTWLPDAHSEAPSVVSALLSGALLNCSFLGILRVQQVSAASGVADFGRGLLIGLGLLSMAFAAVFVLGQKDYKRMLAYSSVEHIGIIALGMGLGGAAIFGALLHAINHSFTKAMMFFASGNILSAYRTKSAGDVRGVLSVLPVTGVIWLVGLFAITGSPPFGTFISEFMIFRTAIDEGRIAIAVAFLALLAVIFIVMAKIIFNMSQGEPSVSPAGVRIKESFFSVLPLVILAAGVLALGCVIPDALRIVLETSARSLGGA